MPHKIFILFTPDGDSNSIDHLTTEIFEECSNRPAQLCNYRGQQVYLGYAHSERIAGLRDNPLVASVYQRVIPDTEVEGFSRGIRAAAKRWNQQYFKEVN